MRIISNSEVTSYNMCKRQHHYRFTRGLEPKTASLSPALYRGIIGHSALEAYYKAMRDGYPAFHCKDAAIDVIKTEISRISKEEPENFDRVQLLLNLIELITNYATVYRQEPFKVLEVERVYKTSLTQELEQDDVSYGMKLDLLIEYTAGPFRGDLAVYDHKFVYNFKTPAELDMDGQLPKYINTLKRNGIVVSKGMFNQIRYRPKKDATYDDIYRRTPARTSPKEINTIWEEQLETASDIILDTFEEFKGVRTLSVPVCRGCYFAPLCKAELMGSDTTHMMKANYQPSTYSYLDLEDS